jgi:LacI family transcriptional regulator
MDYSPNYLARGLAGQETKSVGVLVTALKDQFYVDLVAAMEQSLKGHGYSCLLSTTQMDDAGEQMGSVRGLLGRFVDGLACGGFGGTPDIQAGLAALARAGTPLSMFGEALQAPAFEGVKMDRVICRLGQGCYEMTRHLLELGHRRIAFIGARSARKVAGYRRALEEFGVAFDPRLVVHLVYRFQEVNELRKELMSVRDHPTALFASTDDLAAELVMELLEAGYRIPEDVSVVGINDSWHSKMLRVPLTTLRLPVEEIGQAMAQMLVERIEDPSIEGRVRELDVELVMRESTGPANGKG